MTFLSTIFYFVVGLGLLIFIHEFGHFLVAKLHGIRVERFSLGFGPHVGFKIGETEYCISALPLGGYVKMTGQEDFGEEEIVPLDDPRAFNRKPLLSRLQVVLAGPLMNLILPFILMPIALMIGREEPKFLQEPAVLIGVQSHSSAEQQGLMTGDRILSVQGTPVSTWEDVLKTISPLKPDSKVAVEVRRNGEIIKTNLALQRKEANSEAGYLGFEPFFFIDNEPIVGGFSKNSPAEAAGLQVNDRILEINGQPIKDWFEMSDRVNQSQGKPIELKVSRKADGFEVSGGEPDAKVVKILDFKVTPIFDQKEGKYIIGLSKWSNPIYYEKHSYPLGEAVEKGFAQTAMLFGMTLNVLKDLFTLNLSIKELGGPIKIAEMSGKEGKRGAGNFLFLLAFLSIQLGILNLLPIPVLDGGHVAFMGYEAIARKPLSAKKRLIAQQIGMLLLLGLILVVTFNDIDSVWGYRHIYDSIRGWLFGKGAG